MTKTAGFVHPNALVEGNRYFLRLSLSNERIPLFTQVRLVAYTACPAVVVVQDDRHQHFRCSWESLFWFGKDRNPNLAEYQHKESAL